MKDTVVRDIRAARAEVAEEFKFDLHNFFVWAKAHTDAERKAKRSLPTTPGKVRKNAKAA